MHKNVTKRKKYYKYILFVFIIAALMSTTNISLMAGTYEEPEPPEIPEPEKNPESIVYIEFKEGNAEVDPLDPDDPSNPTPPGNGDGTGDTGSLALNHVSHIFFDEQFISANTEKYPTVTLKPYIQVTDLRGLGAGWEVNARASKFINRKSEREALLGSTITFTDGECVSPTTEVAPPIPKDPVILKADGETSSKIVRAEESAGMGTWLTKWYIEAVEDVNESIILSVPGGTAMQGINIATITWFFMDVPTT